MATTEVNIWEDPDAAAAVRRPAGGCETVPTVVVAGEAMVNPTGPQVLEAVRRLGPDGAASIRPGGAGPGRPTVAWARVVVWSVIVIAVAASVTADRVGRTGLSWALDGVALAAYLVVVVRPRHRRVRTARAEVVTVDGDGGTPR